MQDGRFRHPCNAVPQNCTNSPLFQDPYSVSLSGMRGRTVLFLPSFGAAVREQALRLPFLGGAQAVRASSSPRTRFY